MNHKTIFIGSDHGGYELKQHILEYLQANNHTIIDVYCLNGEKCDYPDAAKAVCEYVLNTENSFGILICRNGIGISIAANKIDGIRSALCNGVYSAETAKSHNNANVIALPSRTINEHLSYRIIDTYIYSRYKGGRHDARLAKITALE